MARAQGARAQLLAAFETSYGVAPSGDFTRIPFVSSGLSSEQPLLESDLLGYGRDPLAPTLDAITVDGKQSVPIDAEAFGFWLSGAFGKPDTSGGSPDPYTHVFKSGGWTLPSLSLEVGMPEVPRFAMYSGVMVDGISWTMQRSGLLTASVQLVSQSEETKAASQAGTPDDLALIRFGNFQGSIKRDGASIGNVISAQIDYSNNLDRIETIRADGMIDGADPSIAALTGNIEVRFADLTLVQQALDGESCELEFSYVSASGESLTLVAHAVYLPRPRLEISGPQGVQATFDWQAALDPSTGRMATVTLVNDVEEY